MSEKASSLVAPASLLWPIMTTATQNKLPFQAICEELGINITADAQRKTTLPVSTIELLVERLIDSSPDKDFDLQLGKQLGLTHIEGLAEYILTSSNARNVLKTITKLKPLILPTMDLVIEPQSNGFEHLIYATGDAIPVSEKPYYPIILFTVLLSFAHKVYPKSQFVHALHLAREKPPYHEKLLEFFECPIHYNQSQSYAIVTTELLDAPFLYKEDKLNQSLEYFLQSQIDKICVQQTYSLRVSAYLREHYQYSVKNRQVNASPTIATVAKYLQTNERQLQRLLSKENSSFAKIRDEVRFQLAIQMITQQRPLKQITEILGFSDYASFARSFKKHTGQSPKNYKHL